MEKYLDAVNYFRKVTDKYTNGKYCPESQYYLAFSYELMRKPVEAKKEFERFMELYPGHAWAGKVKEKLK